MSECSRTEYTGALPPEIQQQFQGRIAAAILESQCKRERGTLAGEDCRHLGKDILVEILTHFRPDLVTRPGAKLPYQEAKKPSYADEEVTKLFSITAVMEIDLEVRAPDEATAKRWMRSLHAGIEDDDGLSIPEEPPITFFEVSRIEEKTHIEEVLK